MKKGGRDKFTVETTGEEAIAQVNRMQDHNLVIFKGCRSGERGGTGLGISKRINIITS